MNGYTVDVSAFCLAVLMMDEKEKNLLCHSGILFSVLPESCFLHFFLFLKGGEFLLNETIYSARKCRIRQNGRRTFCRIAKSL